MRKMIFENGFKLWLSENDIYDWTHRPNDSWPCSTLSGHRLFVEYDSNGLCDLTIDGEYADGEYGLYRDQWIDGHELSSIVADHIGPYLPPGHPCWFVAVGQFESGDTVSFMTPDGHEIVTARVYHSQVKYLFGKYKIKYTYDDAYREYTLDKPDDVRKFGKLSRHKDWIESDIKECV